MTPQTLQLELLSQAELDERAAAAVTPYGVGTRSYNGSAEKREMERQRELATARYEAGPREEVMQPLTCTCPQRPWPHEVWIHRLLKYESRYAVSNEPVMKWPWSLRFLGDMEEVV